MLTKVATAFAVLAAIFAVAVNDRGAFASTQISHRNAASATPSPLFAPIISQLKGGTSVPVYLPSSFSIFTETLYAYPLSLSSTSYEVEIGTMPNCGATACDQASIAGYSGAAIPAYSGTKETLANGVTAYYVPTVCGGAGCDFATLTFPIGSDVYVIGIKSAQLSALLAAANAMVPA